MLYLVSEAVLFCYQLYFPTVLYFHNHTAECRGFTIFSKSAYECQRIRTVFFSIVPVEDGWDFYHIFRYACLVSLSNAHACFGLCHSRSLASPTESLTVCWRYIRSMERISFDVSGSIPVIASIRIYRFFRWASSGRFSINDMIFSFMVILLF